MKFVHYINSPLLWKDSTNTAFAILAGIETLFAVSAISLEKFWGDYSWIIKLLFVIVIFFIYPRMFHKPLSEKYVMWIPCKWFLVHFLNIFPESS